VNKRPPRYGETQVKIKNTLLVDGNALFKVGYFGAKDEYNQNGQHIGGIYSFLTILRKILTEDLYHSVYVFWDGNFSGKLRYEIYEPYKSGRGKDFINGTKPDDINELNQRKIVWEYLNEMYIRQLKDEVVESDDFIAYYCLTRSENEKITIVSNDRDYLQLVSEDIKFYILDMKIYLDNTNFSSYFSFHKDNSLLIKTMVGDTSDTIKGIKGLGETSLLANFPEIKERKVNLNEVIQLAKIKQEERIGKKQKPLKILDNIVNGITDGVQKNKIYEINHRLVNLKEPMITLNAINNLEDLKNTTLDNTGRDLKNVLKMMKRDGIDKALGEYRYSEFLIPFKKLIDRENF
jgi:5'-3' exonuclease